MATHHPPHRERLVVDEPVESARAMGWPGWRRLFQVVGRAARLRCPNCGGGFMPRPVRPAKDRKGGNYLGKYPAGTKVKHRPVDPAAQALLVAALGKMPPEKR